MILKVFPNLNHFMILSTWWTIIKTARATILSQAAAHAALSNVMQTSSCVCSCPCPLLSSSPLAHLALPGHLRWGLVTLCPLLVCLAQQNCTMRLQPQLLTAGTRHPRKLARSSSCIGGLHAAPGSLQCSHRKDICRDLGEMELPKWTAGCQESALEPASLRALSAAAPALGDRQIRSRCLTPPASPYTG